MLMPTEPIPTEIQDEHLLWKIISIVFIVLTSVLFIFSMLLWFALPSRVKHDSQDGPGIGCHFQRPNGEVAY